MAYTYKEFEIPDYMMGSITAYIKDHRACGDFLRSVIQNNLIGACMHADHENIKNLPAYIGYFLNEAPSSCWGSVESYKEWIHD